MEEEMFEILVIIIAASPVGLVGCAAYLRCNPPKPGTRRWREMKEMEEL
jgi:hypothetical protein